MDFMNSKSRILAGVVAMALFGLSPHPARAGSPPAAADTPLVRSGPDVDAIRAIGAEWQALYSAGRYDEIPDLYTEDTMVMPRGRPRIQGREEMRRAIGGLAAGRRVSIEVTEREAFVAGDYGWFVGDFRVTYSSEHTGAAPVTEDGRSLILFRRDVDGHWRIHRDMDSPAPAPAPAVPQPRAAVQEPSATPVPRRDATAAAASLIWNPDSRTIVTECDRLTASRYDRTRLAPPRARQDIDVRAAIAACEADLVRYPDDPRLHFQLARVYGYAGDAAKTLHHRQAAAAAGNHNAIFLLGYLAWNAATDDPARCAAAGEMKLAADRGNYSAQITYASFFLEQRFAPCADRASVADVSGFLAAARPAVDGFFETRLADHLIAQLNARRAADDR